MMISPHTFPNAGAEPFAPANDAPIKFHITTRDYDGTLTGECGWFADSIAAQQHGEHVGGLGCRVTVRPDVETSYLHGRIRHPNALHGMASQEAIDGWAASACVAYSRSKLAAHDRSAMRLQVRQQGVDDVIGGQA